MVNKIGTDESAHIHSDSELLCQYLRGSDDAFNELSRRYQEPLARVVCAHLDPKVAQRVSPSDLIQETWIYAVKRLRAKQAAPDIEVFPWLREIAKERVIDAHRKHRAAAARNVYREQPLDIPSASISKLMERLIDHRTGPLGLLQVEERREMVRTVLRELKPGFREILVLRFIERHKLERCAEILGISVEGAKTRQRRALSSFAEAIGSAE